MISTGTTICLLGLKVGEDWRVLTVEISLEDCERMLRNTTRTFYSFLKNTSLSSGGEGHELTSKRKGRRKKVRKGPAPKNSAGDDLDTRFKGVLWDIDKEIIEHKEINIGERR